MEINYSLDKYIKIIDNPFPNELLEIFIKICKESNNFSDAPVVLENKLGNEIKKKIRKTLYWPMENLTPKSLTEVHWANLLQNLFFNGIKKYCESLNIQSSFRIVDVQVLKYSIGGHYKFHVDHGMNTPRSFSCIYLLNDDYEGGDLMFKFPNGEHEFKIEKAKNRLLIWPSNFLYPHSVLPVTSGERYSVVAWAL